MPNRYLLALLQIIYDSAPQITSHLKAINLKYAYSQLNLNPETTEQRNFIIVSCDMRVTYIFTTAFYGLTDMSKEF